MLIGTGLGEARLPVVNHVVNREVDVRGVLGYANWFASIASYAILLVVLVIHSISRVHSWDVYSYYQTATYAIIHCYY